MLLSYAWDKLLWGDQPLGYHLTNLVLHTVNGVLLLLVLRRLLPGLLMAFVAALLYSIHPAHHSRAAWIAARDSEICLFFLLLAWLAFLAGTPPRAMRNGEDGSRSRWRSLGFAAASCTAFALALLSYEGATAFPFVLTAMHFLLVLDGPWRRRMLDAMRATAPYCVILALYAAWWIILFRGSVGGHDLDWSAGGLGRDFYRMHYRLFANIQHWQGALYLLAGFWFWTQRRHLAPVLASSAGLLWLGFLPFLPVRGYADRFAFLSALGVALLLSLGVTSLSGSRTATDASRLQWSALAPVFILLVLLGDFTRTTQRRIEH
jgi:hypothetical protein